MFAQLVYNPILKLGVMKCNSAYCEFKLQPSTKLPVTHLLFNANKVYHKYYVKKASRFSLFLKDPVFQII